MSLTQKDTAQYLSILGSTGDIRMTVDEGTEGAKLREYETSDGKKGSKWELIYKSISGKIIGIEFFDGEFGMNMVLTFDFEDGNDPVKLSLGTASNYGEDVMKKLPNIKLDEHVVFNPYAFTGDDGKQKKGVSITQGDEKVLSYYWDPEKKKSVNNIPEPDGDTKKYSKDDWKMYFMKVRKFLIEEVKKLEVPERVVAEVTEEEPQDFGDAPKA